MTLLLQCNPKRVGLRRTTECFQGQKSGAVGWKGLAVGVLALFVEICSIFFKKKRKRTPCSMLSPERDEREERTDPFEGWGT